MDRVRQIDNAVLWRTEWQGLSPFCLDDIAAAAQLVSDHQISVGELFCANKMGPEPEEPNNSLQSFQVSHNIS
jgi:hypothetical protein